MVKSALTWKGLLQLLWLSWWCDLRSPSRLTRSGLRHRCEAADAPLPDGTLEDRMIYWWKQTKPWSINQNVQYVKQRHLVVIHEEIEGDSKGNINFFLNVHTHFKYLTEPTEYQFKMLWWGFEIYLIYTHYNNSTVFLFSIRYIYFITLMGFLDKDSFKRLGKTIGTF